jgi:hypothetical protein
MPGLTAVVEATNPRHRKRWFVCLEPAEHATDFDYFRRLCHSKDLGGENATRTNAIITGSLKAATSQLGNSQNSSLRDIDRRSARYVLAVSLGGFMTGEQRQEPLTESSSRDVELVRDLMTASAVRWQQQKWYQEQERQWERRLSDLQQYICELLFKNQKLRELLMSATNNESRESTHEYDQEVTRS